MNQTTKQPVVVRVEPDLRRLAEAVAVNRGEKLSDVVRRGLRREVEMAVAVTTRHDVPDLPGT